ncbi:hypothetical protein M728_005283 (plasmid) [Ensifer sp. WSM1721]
MLSADESVCSDHNMTGHEFGSKCKTHLLVGTKIEDNPLPIDQAEYTTLPARFSWGHAAKSGLSKFGNRYRFPCIFGYRWVRRGMPEPCVPGSGSVRIDRGTKTLSVGSHGQVTLGHAEMLRSSFRKIRYTHGLRGKVRQMHDACQRGRHRCAFIRARPHGHRSEGRKVFQRCPPHNSSQSPTWRKSCWRKSCQKISMPVPC